MTARHVTISEHRQSYGSQKMSQSQSRYKAMAARKCHIHKAQAKMWQLGNATITYHTQSYDSQEMSQAQSTGQAMAARKCHNHRAQTKLWQPGNVKIAEHRQFSSGSQGISQSQSTGLAMAARKCHKGHRPSYGSQENAPIKGHYGRQEIPQSQQAVAARKCYDHRVQANLWQPGNATITDQVIWQPGNVTKSKDQATSARKCHNHRAKTKLWQQRNATITNQGMASRKCNHKPSYGSQEMPPSQTKLWQPEMPQSQTKLWQPGNATITEHIPSYDSQ